MTTVTWLPQEKGIPHQWGATEHGQVFAMVRPRATDGWRVCVFPDGNRENAFESVAGSERQAKRWIERWAAHRNVSYPVPIRDRPIAGIPLSPRKPKGADDRS